MVAISASNLPPQQKNAKKALARAWKKDIQDEKLLHPYYVIFKEACVVMDQEAKEKQQREKSMEAMASSASSGDDGDHDSDVDYVAT